MNSRWLLRFQYCTWLIFTRHRCHGAWMLSTAASTLCHWAHVRAHRQYNFDLYFLFYFFFIFPADSICVAIGKRVTSEIRDASSTNQIYLFVFVFTCVLWTGKWCMYLMHAHIGNSWTNTCGRRYTRHTVRSLFDICTPTSERTPQLIFIVVQVCCSSRN